MFFIKYLSAIVLLAMTFPVCVKADSLSNSSFILIVNNQCDNPNLNVTVVPNIVGQWNNGEIFHMSAGPGFTNVTFNYSFILTLSLNVIIAGNASDPYGLHQPVVGISYQIGHNNGPSATLNANVTVFDTNVASYGIPVVFSYFDTTQDNIYQRPPNSPLMLVCDTNNRFECYTPVNPPVATWALGPENGSPGGLVQLCSNSEVILPTPTLPNGPQPS